MKIQIRNWIRPHRLILLFGLCLGTVGLAGCQSPPDKTVATEYWKFSDQPNNRDVPAVALDEDALEGLDDHYFRFLGVHGPVNFYMARTNHDHTITQGLCFIAVNYERDTAETNCLRPDELDNMVVSLNATSLGAPGEAFLIPDQVHLDLPQGWSQVRRNIVIVTDSEIAPNQVEGQLSGTTDWEDFTLQRKATSP